MPVWYRVNFWHFFKKFAETFFLINKFIILFFYYFFGPYLRPSGIILRSLDTKPVFQVRFPPNSMNNKKQYDET